PSHTITPSDTAKRNSLVDVMNHQQFQKERFRLQLLSSAALTEDRLADVRNREELRVVDEGAQRVATVDGEKLAGGPRRLRPGEVADGVSDVVDLAAAIQRLAVDERPNHLGVVEAALRRGGA